MEHNTFIEHLEKVTAKKQTADILEKKRVLDKFEMYELIECEPIYAEVVKKDTYGVKNMYFKKKYYELSSEQYQLLLEKDNIYQDDEKRRITAMPFQAPITIAFIILAVGIFFGMTMMIYDEVMIGLMSIFSSLVTAVLFLSIGHMIKQLNAVIEQNKP